MQDITMKQLIQTINKVQDVMAENAELKIKVMRLEGEIIRLRGERLNDFIRQDA